MTDDGFEGTFRVLFVCTGNVCRSPFAQLLTAHLLSERLGVEAHRFELASAGVRAMAGYPMNPESRRELPWGLDGADAGRFAARQLAPEMIDEAHLVLTATPEQRVAVLELAPTALDRTFTLREFARLAAAVDGRDLPVEAVDRAHALVGRARALRGAVRPEDPADDAVVDPIGRRAKVHREAAEQITDATRAIVELIAL